MTKIKRLAKDGLMFDNRLLQAFLDHTPVLLNEIQSSLDKGKPMQTSQLIHKLKSSTKLICVDELFNEIFELETNSIHIDRPDYMVAVMKLIPRIESLLQEFKILTMQLNRIHS